MEEQNNNDNNNNNNSNSNDKQTLPQPKKRKKGLIIAIIIISIVVIAAIAGNLSNNVKLINDNGTTTSSSTYYIGDKVINKKNIVFSVLSVENTKHLGSSILGDDTEYNFIVATIKVENRSNSNITIYGGCADLYNSRGNKYESASSIYIDDIIMEDIGPGISKTFQVLFETPTTTIQEQYTIKIGYSTYTLNADRVSVILKDRP